MTDAEKELRFIREEEVRLGWRPLPLLVFPRLRSWAWFLWRMVRGAKGCAVYGHDAHSYNSRRRGVHVTRCTFCRDVLDWEPMEEAPE